MSALSRFMSTTRDILDERDARPRQPPFFVRTKWLFAELELLATAAEEGDFEDIKIARIETDLPAARRALERIDARTAELPTGRLRHERRQLFLWIIEQIEREPQS